MVQLKKIVLQYKLVEYVFIGGLSTLIHFVIATLYLYLVNDGAVFVANILGFLSAFSFSYLLQSIYVFEHAISLKQALRYFVVQSSSLLITFTISHYSVLQNSYLKTLLIALLLPIITFFIHKIWTFKKGHISENY